VIVHYRSFVLLIAISLIASQPAPPPQLAASGQAAARAKVAAEATIRRDTFGVPHIIANTEAAAAEAQGYATA
jgi:acyl-homoserine lactone acylase PvdQ